ncbi:hypothetical protein, partial [Photorhabdus bodei]|uniref:hypothetical protein n=1 Tax=Photorhabdus bodei TaxID=2029681 RepID=UPI001E61C353
FLVYFHYFLNNIYPMDFKMHRDGKGVNPREHIPIIIPLFPGLKSCHINRFILFLLGYFYRFLHKITGEKAI